MVSVRTGGVVVIAIGILVASALWLATREAAKPPMGAFRLQDGRVFTIAEGSKGARMIGANDGFVRELESCGLRQFCARNGRDPGRPVVLKLDFSQVDGKWLPANAPEQTFVPLPLVARRFKVRTDDGITLSALLVLPNGPGPHPLIALAHGSGDEAATRVWHHPWQFAAYGIATVIYDKRGTGDSGGAFTADFDRLSRDLNAVLDAAKKDPDIDPGRLGLMGSSQGGWIAPLAATKRHDLKAVVVNFGLAVSPLEEERSEALLPFAQSDAESREQATRLVDAAMQLLGNGFQGDWDAFKSLCAEYADAPWRDKLDNNTVNEFCANPVNLIQSLGPEKITPGLNFNYEPMPVLRSLSVPMLWTIAEADLEAPPERTLQVLRELIDVEQRPITVRVFPGTDHGMVRFRLGANGERLVTGFDPDFIPVQVDYLRTQFEMPAAVWANGPAPDQPSMP